MLSAPHQRNFRLFRIFDGELRSPKVDTGVLLRKARRFFSLPQARSEKISSTPTPVENLVPNITYQWFRIGLRATNKVIGKLELWIRMLSVTSSEPDTEVSRLGIVKTIGLISENFKIVSSIVWNTVILSAGSTSRFSAFRGEASSNSPEFPIIHCTDDWRTNLFAGGDSFIDCLPLLSSEAALLVQTNEEGTN